MIRSQHKISLKSDKIKIKITKLTKMMIIIMLRAESHFIHRNVKRSMHLTLVLSLNLIKFLYVRGYVQSKNLNKFY